MTKTFNGRPIVPKGLLRDAPDGPDTSNFVLEDFFTFRFLLLARALDREAKRVYGELFGLSLVEYRILAKLGSVGSATVNRLASWMAYDKAQISRAVTSLVGNGYLNRATNAADTRSAILTLTESGEQLYNETIAIGRDRQRALLARLSPEQRREIYETMALLMDQLGKHDPQIRERMTEQQEDFVR